MIYVVAFFHLKSSSHLSRQLQGDHRTNKTNRNIWKLNVCCPNVYLIWWAHIIPEIWRRHEHCTLRKELGKWWERCGFNYHHSQSGFTWHVFLIWTLRSNECYEYEWRNVEFVKLLVNLLHVQDNFMQSYFSLTVSELWHPPNQRGHIEWTVVPHNNTNTHTHTSSHREAQ